MKAVWNRFDCCIVKMTIVRVCMQVHLVFPVKIDVGKEFKISTATVLVVEIVNGL